MPRAELSSKEASKEAVALLGPLALQERLLTLGHRAPAVALSLCLIAGALGGTSAGGFCSQPFTGCGEI